jgi:hypothetical protein
MKECNGNCIRSGGEECSKVDVIAVVVVVFDLSLEVGKGVDTVLFLSPI